MIIPKTKLQVTDPIRAILGFIFGFVIMLVVTNIFIVNRFDFNNIYKGTLSLISGGNPWSQASRLPDFYNPPFSILFLWPLLFLTPKLIIAIGGAFLFAIVFYRKAWLASSWFLTNTFLFVISSGNIDMFVIGIGLSLLFIGDSNKLSSNFSGIVFRVIAYGFLLIKPQGGLFIVIIYILMRRDWKGLFISLIIYGLFFITLYPDWINVILHDSPRSQNIAAHSILKKFGIISAIIVAISVTLSRKWKYWQLGGVLAGILSPYGMPGIPIFLALSAVNDWKAFPIVIFYSAGLTILTWLNPPAGVDFYAYISPFMSIYHLGMLSLAIILACCLPGRVEADKDTIDVFGWIKSVFYQYRLNEKFNSIYIKGTPNHILKDLNIIQKPDRTHENKSTNSHIP